MFTCISSTMGPLKVFKNQLLCSEGERSKYKLERKDNELGELIKEICMEDL